MIISPAALHLLLKCLVAQTYNLTDSALSLSEGILEGGCLQTLPTINLADLRSPDSSTARTFPFSV